MTANSFPEFITARRRELELTLGDVASRLGVSPITVSNWSSGDATPKAEKLVALAKLLEVPPEELADMAGITLKSSSDGVNLMPPGAGETTEETGPPVADETEVSEPIAELRPTEPHPPPDRLPVGEPEPQVPIPEYSHEEAAEPEKPEPVEAAEEAPDAVPAFVAAAPAAKKPPAAQSRPGTRVPAARAPAADEHQVTTLPLTYIEDPKQLMRYRIRWALTVVILFIMFIVLLWASRELLSALSEVKQAVTPGGIGGG